MTEYVKIPTLIVGKPGHLLNGLSSLLKAHPNLSVIAVVESAERAITTVEKNTPKLVLWDSMLPEEELSNGMHRIKELKPDILCIIMAEHTGQHYQPLKAVLDEIIMKGFSAEQLYRTVTRLLGNSQRLIQ